jgi:transcriptional regulator with XRE-family HTH domain
MENQAQTEIQKLILASGKTRDAIADEAGMSRQALWNIARGKTKARMENAYPLARALGCPVQVIRPDIAGYIS